MLVTDDDARDDDARYVARTMYTQMWNPTKINFRFDSSFLVQPNWAAISHLNKYIIYVSIHFNKFISSV